jgi:Uma2 family endonuclease
MESVITEEKIWTYEDYLELDDGIRYEIIKGELSMVPAPSLYHQRLSRKIEMIFIEYIEKHNLGEIFDAPVDVILDEQNTVQPDIVFVASENSHILKYKGIFGAPDLIVEIISPSSVYRDTHEKKNLYEKFDVKEYWIVDMGNVAIEVFTLQNQKYELFSFVAEKGSVKSKIIEGFELDITKIMPNLDNLDSRLPK